MGNYVSEQLALFLQSIALGAVLGLIYDLLGVLRSLGGRLWGGVLDALFCLTAACAVFLFVMAGDGELRIFIILGIVGGAVLFWCLLGGLLRPIWRFWLGLLLFPVRLVKKFLGKCGRKGKKVFSFWQNWVTIKFTTLRRRKISGEQEGDEEMSAPSGKKTARPPQKRKKKAAVRPRSRITVILLAALLVGISVQIYRMFGQLQDARAQDQPAAPGGPGQRRKPGSHRGHCPGSAGHGQRGREDLPLQQIAQRQMEQSGPGKAYSRAALFCFFRREGAAGRLRSPAGKPRTTGSG